MKTKNIHILFVLTGFVLSYYSYLPNLWGKLNVLAQFGGYGIVVAGIMALFIIRMIRLQYQVQSAASNMVNDSIKDLRSPVSFRYKVLHATILIITVAGAAVIGYATGDVLKRF